MAVSASRDTKSAILDAAEVLMAKHGIHGVSLRQILAKAGANTAALHYHFGSRALLIDAILERGGVGINLRRRALLDAPERRDAQPRVYDVVDALLDPMLDMLDERGEAGRRFYQFLARLHSDRTGIIESIELEYFPDNYARVGRMLASACPHVPEAERARRVTMMLDTMLQSLANADAMSEAWDSEAQPAALHDYARSLRDFLAGGLSAPVHSDRAEEGADE